MQKIRVVSEGNWKEVKQEHLRELLIGLILKSSQSRQEKKQKNPTHHQWATGIPNNNTCVLKPANCKSSILIYYQYSYTFLFYFFHLLFLQLVSDYLYVIPVFLDLFV